VGKSSVGLVSCRVVVVCHGGWICLRLYGFGDESRSKAAPLLLLSAAVVVSHVSWRVMRSQGRDDEGPAWDWAATATASQGKSKPVSRVWGAAATYHTQRIDSVGGECAFNMRVWLGASRWFEESD
jgi:hypothetical protein